MGFWLAEFNIFYSVKLEIASAFPLSLSLFPSFLSVDTGQNNGRSFISSIFRQTAHETAQHIFASPDNFIKRCAFGNVINIPTVCSRGSYD